MVQLKEEPPDSWIEPIYKKQLEKSTQFSQYMALYKNGIALNTHKPSYIKLKEMVSYFLADAQNQTQIRSLTTSGQI